MKTVVVLTRVMTGPYCRPVQAHQGETSTQLIIMKVDIEASCCLCGTLGGGSVDFPSSQLGLGTDQEDPEFCGFDIPGKVSDLEDGDGGEA
jgi:hypothetical protein